MIWTVALAGFNQKPANQCKQTWLYDHHWLSIFLVCCAKVSEEAKLWNQGEEWRVKWWGRNGPWHEACEHELLEKLVWRDAAKRHHLLKCLSKTWRNLFGACWWTALFYKALVFRLISVMLILCLTTWLMPHVCFQMSWFPQAPFLSLWLTGRNWSCWLWSWIMKEKANTAETEGGNVFTARVSEGEVTQQTLLCGNEEY